jgi:hypothetical protein
MSIEIIKEDGDVTSIRIDGEELETDDGGEFFTPKSLLINKKINELPIDVRFSICDKIEEGIIFLENIRFTLTRIDSKTVEIIF